MATTEAPPMAVTEGPPAPPTVADPPSLPDPAPRTPPIPSQPAAPGVNATKDPGVWQRDRKLKELEDKVQQLLKEMQQLRGQAPAGGMMPPSGVKSTTPQEAFIGLLREATGSGLVAPAPAPPTVQVEPTPAHPPVPAVPDNWTSGTVTITLTRVSYHLKPATAEALSTFLKDNAKTAILETKSEGENLVVTTTPAAQQAIGQFIHLLQGPTAMPAPMKTKRPAERPPDPGPMPSPPIDPLLSEPLPPGTVPAPPRGTIPELTPPTTPPLINERR